MFKNERLGIIVLLWMNPFLGFPRVMEIDDQVKEEIPELTASRALWLVNVKERRPEKSTIPTGNEAGALWIIPEAARFRDCQ